MVKDKNKKTAFKATYLKCGGIAWIVLVIITLSNINAFRLFEAFTGSNPALSLLLSCLVLSPGAISLAYGILLSEHKPDLRSLRIGALAVAILLASLVAYSWAYLIVNGL